LRDLIQRIALVDRHCGCKPHVESEEDLGPTGQRQSDKQDALSCGFRVKDSETIARTSCREREVHANGIRSSGENRITELTCLTEGVQSELDALKGAWFADALAGIADVA